MGANLGEQLYVPVYAELGTGCLQWSSLVIPASALFVFTALTDRNSILGANDSDFGKDGITNPPFDVLDLLDGFLLRKAVEEEVNIGCRTYNGQILVLAITSWC